MAESFVRLTLKSDQYERRLKEDKKMMDDFVKSIGINMKSMSKMAMVAGTVTTALKVMTDAFKSSQTNIDEWGRTVEASKALYTGFLDALNNSDISGFLSRMDEITTAARNAYDAMSDLQMYNAFNQMNVAESRAGYAEALDEYKLNPNASNKNKLTEANEKVINELKDAQIKAEDAYRTALQKIATSRLKTKELQDKFVNTFSKGTYEDFQEAGSSFTSGKGLNAGAQYYYGDRVYDGRIQDRGTGKWRDMSDVEKEQFEFARAISQVTQEQVKEVQALGAQSVAIKTQIYQQNRQFNRAAGNNQKATNPSKSGGGNTTTEPTYAADSIAAQQALVQQLTKEWNEAGAEVRNSYVQPLVEAEAKLKQMKDEQELLKEQSQGKLKGGEVQTTGLGGTNFRGFAAANTEIGKGIDALTPLENKLENLIELQNTFGRSSAEAWQSYQIEIDNTNKKIEEFKGISPTKDINKDVEALTTTAKNTATVVGTIGQAFNAIEDPAAKVAGTVAMAIAQVALAYGQAMAADPTLKTSIYGLIAGAAAAMISMTTTIANIHSSTGYAQGGMIKGNSYSGDNIGGLVDGSHLVGLNAGEVVLNASQQNMLAQNLQGDGGGMRIVGVLKGHDMALMLDRWGMTTGRGELLFGKNL